MAKNLIIEGLKHARTPNSINSLLKRRTAACMSLEKSLANKSKLEIIEILTSWLSIEELEKLAKFQDRN